MGFDREIECIGLAHRLDLLTTPYAFDPEQASALARVGADIIVAHMGLTTSGTIGARTARTLEDCVTEVAAIVEACKSVREDVLVLCHGGPIASPDDARFMLERVRGLDGFYGASSMERLPTETAITRQTRDFAGLRLNSSRHRESSGWPGQSEVERGALPRLAVEAHFPAVRLDDLVADCQPDARPLEFLLGMEPSEHLEDPAVVAAVDADPVVPDQDGPHGGGA